MTQFVTALFPSIRTTNYLKRILGELFHPKIIPIDINQSSWTPEQLAIMKEQKDALNTCA